MLPAFLRPVALLTLSAAISPAADRQLANAWEVRNEIALANGVNPAMIRDYFPTFQDYIDTVLFHPSAGYYSSGRVDFFAHYRTFPNALSPSFGQMIAEHIFQMWSGMRKAGTLSTTEKFTIAEFGPGTGALAESILNHIDTQAAVNSNKAWADFQKQVVYAAYDRSPALSDMQTKRNSRFGARFEARIADATNPNATIAVGSLKGVVLSNELPDCFSVHKVILGTDGSAEVGYAAPSIWNTDWPTVSATLPESVRQKVIADDAAIHRTLFAPPGRAAASNTTGRIYLSKASFNAVLDAFSKQPDYEAHVNQIEFQEVYVPVTVIPEVAEHIRRYASVYATRIARTGQGLVTYVNPGEGKFIQGAGAALKAGYVITIDYGDNWDGILDLKFDHLRMYGPGASSSQANPYQYPTLNDMTTDANFSHIATEGTAVGLRPLYFGAQHALQDGTPIKLDKTPPERSTEHEAIEFTEWAGLFYSWEVYKVLVQQKTNTDPAYKFPGDEAEPLEASQEGLTAAQRTRMTQLTQQFQRAAQ